MPNVEVTIMTDGSIRPEFFGFTGDACLEADQHLRRRLAAFGLTLEEAQIIPKPELFAETTEQHAVLNQHRQER